MDFAAVIKRVWSDIQEAELPPELHAIAFEAGVRHAYETVMPRPESPRIESEARSSNERGPATDVSDGPIQRLSAETGVSQERLTELIYFDEDGQPGINVVARRLGKNNSERARNVALVVASARHFGNDEIDVRVSFVREACKALGVYDQDNFAKHIANVPGFILSGPKANRVLRAKADAAARLQQLVSGILGEVNGE